MVDPLEFQTSPQAADEVDRADPRLERDGHDSTDRRSGGKSPATPGVLFLVDAAQDRRTLADRPAQNCPSTSLAAPGHKGLLGPLGTGILYLAPWRGDAAGELSTGGARARAAKTTCNPSRSPTNMNQETTTRRAWSGSKRPRRGSWRAAWNRSTSRRRALVRQLLEGLTGISRMRVFGPASAQGRVAVVSLGIEGTDPQDGRGDPGSDLWH